MLKTLKNLGFKQVDAEVYLFLSKMGSQKGRNIAGNLKLYKQQLYCSLKRLQNKGFVRATAEHPALFSAVPLEKVLDLFLIEKAKQAETLQANRDELLSSWISMIKNSKES